MAFLCVSQQGEFKNTITNVLGKIIAKSFLVEHLREKNFFPVVFPLRFVSRMSSLVLGCFLIPTNFFFWIIRNKTALN
jgi:hypothetical protein